MVPVTGTLVPKHDVSYGLFVQIHAFVQVYSISITENITVKGSFGAELNCAEFPGEDTS